MPKIFFISGLGANEKAFNNIGELPYEKTLVKWLIPYKKESIDEYSQRIIAEYNIQPDDVLAGLSFGGLLSQKIAEINGNETVILLSSFRDKLDLKWLFKIGLQLKLHLLQPPFRIPIVDEFVINFLNSDSTEGKKVLKEMLLETNYTVSKWSLKMIAQASSQADINYTRYLIVGNKDKMVKVWDHKNRWIIEGGSHFLVFDHGKQVTQIIKEIIGHSAK